MADWARATQASSSQLPLASTSVGWVLRGYSWVARAKAHRMAPRTDRPPMTKGSNTRPLLTWGLAQSRGHPQKGRPEVGAQGDMRGILRRQQGRRL